jgi:hypothetical protein
MSGLPSKVCQASGAAKLARNMASAYWVSPPAGKAKLEKTGEARMRGTSPFASITKGLPFTILESNDRMTGTSIVGMVVVTGAGAWPATA